MIHSFLAAYTGKDLNLNNPANVSLNITQDVKSRGYIPAPNWSVRWNGLSKLDAFRDIFSSFTVTHAYKSNLKVSRYETDLQFQSSVEEFGTRFYIPTDQEQANYYSLFEIPAVVISEQFVPIIGIDIKTTNDINMNFEYKKTRNLSLITGNISQLTEARNTEYTVGFGWTLQNVNIGGRKRSRRGRQAPDVTNQAPTDTGGAEPEGRQMTINFDMSFRDDVTWIHEIDKGTSADPIRGLKTLRINPSVDYELNENLTLRGFVDFSKTQPYLSTSYPITSVQGGITARFNLD